MTEERLDANAQGDAFGFDHLHAGVVIAATLDTKGVHVEFLRTELERRQVPVIVVDCSIRPAAGCKADIGAAEIATMAGTTIGAVRAMTSRPPGLQVMLTGLQRTVGVLQAAGKLRGFIGLGGGTNASLAARAFAALPYGAPKILVSTAASGDTKPFVEGSDVVLIHPVVDFIGLNAPMRASLSRAAAAMAGMIDIPFWDPADTALVIGVTATGATTAAAEAADSIFRARGHETYMFHARGPGGIAFEDLTHQGRIAAAFDLATTEIIDEVVGGLRSAGPKRLEAASRAGIPQVVVPGGIDTVNFSGPDSVPSRFSGRQFVSHTPSSTLMRTSVAESQEAGAWMGRKLALARGPTAVLIPLIGFSSYDAPGAIFHDPEASRAFSRGIASALAARSDIPVETLDLHINDPAFVRLAATRLCDMIDAAGID